MGVLSAGGVLDRIVEAKAERLGRTMLQKPLDLLTGEVRTSKPRSSFAERLLKNQPVSVIAEIKHRSPSRGVIREAFDPVKIAASYTSAGAAALSVLTEEDFFAGSLDHLVLARSRAKIPLLRKDFIFDEYQVYESAIAGADAILLIVAILDDELLKQLITLSSQLGLDALVEVHTEAEMRRGLDAGAQVVGVNNRDLTTFTVTLETSMKLAQMAPPDITLVSESGIQSGEDIFRLKQAGFTAFLIGEHLMRAEDPGARLKELIAETVTCERAAV
jgi:indole-3-glycerol phosphate synthase